MNTSLKIAMIQDRLGFGMREDFAEILKKDRPNIIAFPEHYFLRPGDDNVIVSAFRHNEIIVQLLEWSLMFDCVIIGGSFVAESNGKLYNRSYIINKGSVTGYYDKIHLFKNEGRGLIKKGSEYKVFELSGLRIGILICADVLYSESFLNIRGLKPDLIFVPTTSPYRENEPAKIKFARDKRLFAQGARLSDSIIFKICAVGGIGKHKFQARSLIASPNNILWRNPPDEEDKSALIMAKLTNLKTNPKLDITVHRL